MNTEEILRYIDDLKEEIYELQIQLKYTSYLDWEARSALKMNICTNEEAIKRLLLKL